MGDHGHLQNLERVFRQLDTSGDGVLSLDEIREGFKKIFGEDQPEGKKVEEHFQAMDLDGSGTVDYTEFCAAGLGRRESLKEEALWAAFRSLDRDGVSGKLTADDITSALAEADVERSFTVKNCGEVARELLRRWDTDSDGGIDFEEFRALMTGNTMAPLDEHIPKEEEGVVKPPYLGPGSRRSASRSF